MSPSLLDFEGEGQSNGAMHGSSLSPDHVFQGGLGLKECDYLGLSDCSSVDSSNGLEESKTSLNLKATELRLGLPGSQSPERDMKDEKPLFPLVPLKDAICSSSRKCVVSGNKREFSDTEDEGNWMSSAGFSDRETAQSSADGKATGDVRVTAMLSSRRAVTDISTKASQRWTQAANQTKQKHINSSTDNSSAPAAKAQVVGWPPVKSVWKTTVTTVSKNNGEADGKPSPGGIFVKVSMDGAPYLRKVDLRSYSTYQQLSSALEKMFSCFIIGRSGSQSASQREMLSESKLRDPLHGTEYVLTYEDKDGDWMLVGDVPWEMFVGSCKKLKIMKGSDAIGLAPRAMEKSKNKI